MRCDVGVGLLWRDGRVPDAHCGGGAYSECVSLEGGDNGVIELLAQVAVFQPVVPGQKLYFAGLERLVVRVAAVEL